MLMHRLSTNVLELTHTKEKSAREWEETSGIAHIFHLLVESIIHNALLCFTLLSSLDSTLPDDRHSDTIHIVYHKQEAFVKRAEAPKSPKELEFPLFVLCNQAAKGRNRSSHQKASSEGIS